ncbi:hypothetical protein GTU99_22320, partial [Streptomyces sp. PRKS01-65]
MNVPASPPPVKSLQFRLRNFHEHEGTDSGGQGAGDETWVSAIGLDSSSLALSSDGKAVLNQIASPRVGRMKDQRAAWVANPFVLLEFDLRKPGDWPRTYTVILQLVEEDNQDLADSFNRIEAEVGTTARAAVVKAAQGAGAVAGAALAGPVGAVALGFIAGEVAGPVYDAIVGEIKRGLGNEVFKPIPLSLTIKDPALAAAQPRVNAEQVERIRQHGADYGLFYDWHLVPAEPGTVPPATPPPQP